MAAPSSNVIIGFDIINAQVKVLTIPGTTYQRGNLQTFNFDRKLLDAGDYVSIVESVFENYDMASLQNAAVSLVLPNNIVGIDYVGIPTMKRNKMIEAVEVEFKALYKNNEALTMLPVPIISSKKNALFMLIITNRPMLNGMVQVFTAKKIPVRVKTFEGNALANAALQLRPKTRRASFIFIDIKENSTSFAVINKERTVGFQNLPYGYSILSRSEVNVESMLIDHDVAELASINATEMAKKKKLTITEDEAEEAEEAARAAEEAAAKEAQAAEAATTEEAPKESENPPAENGDGEGVSGFGAEGASMFDDNGEEKKEEVKKPAAKVFAKKVPKALPMFMQRPIPETEEGFILENFRMFEKRVLLLKKYCDFDNIMPTPEFVLVNMPKEFEFIIEQLNLDEDNGIEYRYFGHEAEDSDEMLENLDLIGAMYAGTWNKTHNFN